MSSLSDNVTIKIRGGLEADLPSEAPERELLVTTNTDKLYVGKGPGVAPKLLFGGSTGHVTNRVIYDDNHGVYADGMKGSLDPKGREGWYFTNAVTGSKISWYYYDPTQINTTVGQFLGTYAIVTIDTNRIPYFALYTQGNDFVWYKSRRVYAVQNPATVVPGKYLIYTGVNPNVYPELPRIEMTETTTLSNGAFASGEMIAYVTLQTASDVTAGNYKFVVHQLGLSLESEQIEFALKTKSDYTKVIQVPAALPTWTIVHNMGKRPSVTTVDTNGNVITGQVVYNSDNQLTIYFSPAVAGTVYLN